MKKLKILVPVLAVLALSACRFGENSSEPAGSEPETSSEGAPSSLIEASSEEPETSSEGAPSSLIEASSEEPVKEAHGGQLPQGGTESKEANNTVELLAESAASTIDKFATDQSGYGIDVGFQSTDINVNVAYALPSYDSEDNTGPLGANVVIKAVDLDLKANFDQPAFEAAVVSNSGVRVTAAAQGLNSLLGGNDEIALDLDLKTGPLSAYVKEGKLYLDAHENNFAQVINGVYDTLMSASRPVDASSELDSESIAAQEQSKQDVLSPFTSLFEGLKGYVQLPDSVAALAIGDQYPGKELMKNSLKQGLEAFFIQPELDSSEEASYPMNYMSALSSLIKVYSYEDGRVGAGIAFNNEALDALVPAEAWASESAPTVRKCDINFAASTDVNKVINKISFSCDVDFDANINGGLLTVKVNGGFELSIEGFGKQAINFPAALADYEELDLSAIEAIVGNLIPGGQE